MSARDKLELWFFRELSDEQRLSLFSIFGYPVDEIGKVHGHQRKVLLRVLADLSIIRDDENHKATVERCIAAVQDTFVADTLSPKTRIAAALRSLIKEDGEC